MGRGFVAEDVVERAGMYDVPATAVHMAEQECQVIYRPLLMGPEKMATRSFSSVVG